MLNAEQVKQFARAAGADLVGIAPIERWEGAPIQQDPRQIMPEARSVIVLALRIHRGSLRGIEEGTFFANYTGMGYMSINWVFMPMLVRQLANLIEDEGYEAIPYGHQSPWRAIDAEGEVQAKAHPVEPGRAVPDVAVHLRIAAYLAGLGEIGYSKVFLTPQFGPRQRLGIVLTEAELEPDPLYDGPPMCNRCMACVRECPGQAISGEKTVKVTLAGREVEWGELDVAACEVAFQGGKRLTDPDHEPVFLDEGMRGMPITPNEVSPWARKPGTNLLLGPGICGGRGCMRGCMITLEERGVVGNKFHEKFRRRKPWRMDWPVSPEEAGDPGKTD